MTTMWSISPRIRSAASPCSMAAEATVFRYRGVACGSTSGRGNVRELENLILREFLRADGDMVSIEPMRRR